MRMKRIRVCAFKKTGGGGLNSVFIYSFKMTNKELIFTFMLNFFREKKNIK